MLGVRYATGALVNRYGYRTRLSATLTCWVSFSLYPACTPISCRMLGLRSRSNMGSRCIRPMAILRDFQNYAGQIRLALNEGMQQWTRWIKQQALFEIFLKPMQPFKGIGPAYLYASQASAHHK